MINHPIATITLARLREFIRRPETIFWVYFFPVLMVVVLGIAFRNEQVETFEIDLVTEQPPSWVVEGLRQSDRVTLNQLPLEESLKRLRSGRTNLIIDLGTNTIEQVETNAGRKAWEASGDVRYQFDPTRPGSRHARNFVDDQLQRAAGRQDRMMTEDVPFSEPGGRYVDFLVPGLLAMSLMGGGLWGVGYAIVDMRIRKLLKRLMATPMRRSHFLLGMLFSRLIFMIPQIVILLVCAYFLFDVRVYGNWGSVVLVIMLGAIEFSVIGLLVAARAQAMETVSGLMNMVMLPMYTLSGIFFSYERFPEVIHPLIKWLPLTPVIDALRALMMEGQSIVTLWPELGIITLWSVVPFIVALAIFRWND